MRGNTVSCAGAPEATTHRLTDAKPEVEPVTAFLTFICI